MDPANALAEKERESSETQSAMGNIESVPKKFKKLIFFDKSWPEQNFWRNLS